MPTAPVVPPSVEDGRAGTPVSLSVTEPGETQPRCKSPGMSQNSPECTADWIFIPIVVDSHREMQKKLDLSFLLTATNFLPPGGFTQCGTLRQD